MAACPFSTLDFAIGLAPFRSNFETVESENFGVLFVKIFEPKVVKTPPTSL